MQIKYNNIFTSRSIILARIDKAVNHSKQQTSVVEHMKVILFTNWIKKSQESPKKEKEDMSLSHAKSSTGSAAPQGSLLPSNLCCFHLIPSSSQPEDEAGEGRMCGKLIIMLLHFNLESAHITHTSSPVVRTIPKVPIYQGVWEMRGSTGIFGEH